MELKQLVLLLPCHSLEDFPTHHKDQDALDLLLAWTTLWHPSLIKACGKKPSWNRCEQPPEDCAGTVILIPEVSRNRVPSGFLARCEEQQGLARFSTADRDADAQWLLDQCSIAADTVTRDTVVDFYALAYTYLQIQLLTRQLRYSSNLDEVHFEAQLVKAANAAAAGDNESCQRALGRCFDVLSEERHRYYPTTSYLLDLTLLAPTTLGKRLHHQLESEHSHNYLVTASLLQTLQNKSPDTFALLKERHQSERALFVGGGINEAPTGLLSYQALLDTVESGQQFFEQEFGKPLHIFARRTSGLEHTLPSVLSFAGFHAAIHETFEDAKIPAPASTNFRWQGPDGQFINSLTKTVLDAAQPNVFLRMGIQIGEALDIDHLAIMQLVHWPGETCPIYHDLARSAQRCDALGSWTDYSKVFAAVHEPGYFESNKLSDYTTNYLGQLTQATEADPTPEALTAVDWIGRARKFIQNQSRRSAASNLTTMVQLAHGPRAVPAIAHWETRLAAISSKAMPCESNLIPNDGIQAEQLDELAKMFAQALTTDSSDCQMIINPSSQPQRILLTSQDLKGFSLEHVPADQIYHTCRELTTTWAIVDIPAMGYVHLTAGKTKIPEEQIKRQKSAKQSGKILVNQTTMRNEFLEATIDSDTGAIRSIHNYEKRGNICSLQLAWYDAELKKLIQAALKKEGGTDWRENLAQLWKGKGDERERQLALHYGGYTAMKADSIKTITNNSAVAQVRATGQLMIRKKAVADFILDYRMIRGSRFIEIRAQITPHHQSQEIKLGKNRTYNFPPENQENASGYRNFFNWRLAHAQPTADQMRDINSIQQPVYSGRFTAPHFVEWAGQHRLTWHCKANAFHKVPKDGKLDTLIGHLGQSVYHSDVAVGLGPKNTMTAAETSDMAPLKVPCGKLKASIPAAAWLMNCSTRNVSVIDCKNLYQDNQFNGIRIRILETMGKERKFQLEFAMPPREVNVRCNDPNFKPPCNIDAAQIQCEIGPYEMLELTIGF